MESQPTELMESTNESTLEKWVWSFANAEIEGGVVESMLTDE